MFKLTVYYNKKQKRLVQIQGSFSTGSDLLPLFTSEGDMQASINSCNAFCSGFIARGYNTEVINDIKEFGNVAVVNAQKAKEEKDEFEDYDDDDEEEEELDNKVDQEEEDENENPLKCIKSFTNIDTCGISSPSC